MTREEIIKKIKPILEELNYSDAVSYLTQNDREWLEETIKALEKELKSDWIPVSERLPNSEYGESDSVLVCFENETQDVLYFNGGNWCYPTGETYISVNHKNGWHNKVVAWMPLPKQYDPQESEDKE